MIVFILVLSDEPTVFVLLSSVCYQGSHLFHNPNKSDAKLFILCSFIILLCFDFAVARFVALPKDYQKYQVINFVIHLSLFSLEVELCLKSRSVHLLFYLVCYNDQSHIVYCVILTVLWPVNCCFNKVILLQSLFQFNCIGKLGHLFLVAVWWCCFYKFVHSSNFTKMSHNSVLEFFFCR